MNVLIIDDDLVSRLKMEKIFQTIASIKSASNGKNGFELFKSSLENKVEFDIIVLDIGLPDIGGVEILKEMRQLETENALQESKIIMVTSHADRETVIQCIQAGCSEHLVKPFDRKAVMEKCKNLGFF